MEVFGDEIKTTMPNEAEGFFGTLSGTVAKLGSLAGTEGKSGGNDWFVIKVVNVLGFSKNNKRLWSERL